MANFQRDEVPWHPKISPYRLTVLATTIGLGTAKAITAQMGVKFISTTLEWVSGTAIFLILFLVSPYDSNADAPQYLSWFFKPDCMDLIWRLLAIFSVSRPNYLSRERAPNPNFNHPPITTYRLFVCSLVVAFGVSKAAFGYLGFSTAATWADWVLGVVATSIFYCLGLYEASASNLWPSFFADDRRQRLYSVAVTTTYIAGTALSATWVLYWKGVLEGSWQDPTFAQAEPDVEYPIFDTAFHIAFKYFLFELMFLSTSVGAICFILVLRLATLSIVPRAVFRNIRGRIFGILLPSFFAGNPSFTPSFTSNRYIQRIKTFLHVCTHITLHACVLTGSLALSFLMIGGVAVLCELMKRLDNVFVMVIFWYVGFYICLMTFMVWVCDCVILCLMIAPLACYMYGDYHEFRKILIFSSEWISAN